ncbi:hypothetical protein pb186bvf_006544 [Paramecium bursaria]
MQKFNEKEIIKMKQRFERRGVKQQYEEFREMLGIFGVGHAQFISLRLFKQIERGRGYIKFEDYLDYLTILTYGSEKQKAQMSFRFLDYQNKGSVLIKDVEQLCLDVILFWNFMTGSTSTPNQTEVKKLISLLDQQKTGVITMEQFCEGYQLISEELDWYEFFNEQSQKELNIHNPIYEHAKLDMQMNVLQDQIYNCMIQLKNSPKPDFDLNISKIAHIDYSFDGPLCLSIQQVSKNGDADPQDEISDLNRELSMMGIQTDFLDQLEDRLINMSKLFETEAQEVYVDRKAKKQNSTDKRRATVLNIARKGKSIYFGHVNWNLILNMMIGIRQSVKCTQTFEINLSPSHFEEKHLHDIMAQRIDFKIVYKFIDYAPQVFDRIRKLFNISQTSYLRSVGPENLLGNFIIGKLYSLSELSSSGKSGSFFYFTEDSKYMIKTISKNEFQLLRQILPKYYTHMCNNPLTLLSKIYGLHQIKMYKSKKKQKKLYLIVMQNLFETSLTIDVRYDLKGSTYDRQTRKKGKLIDKTVALKDLDFIDDNQKLNLGQQQKQLLLDQIMRDSHFLEQCNIIDYSLLIGVHERRSTKNIEQGLLSQNQQEIYFIGIIDILTEFNAYKKIENKFKSTFVDSNVSCIPPNAYKKLIQFQ